jgi:putative transposase
MSIKATESFTKQDENTTSRTKTSHSRLARVVEAISTRLSLLQFVFEQGLSALRDMMHLEAEHFAGPKGKHRRERTHNHWGYAPVELPLGGRKIMMQRPRVRRRDGREETLPCVTAFQNEDALAQRVQEQILAGVSTRNYERSLDEPVDGCPSRGSSKSSASRHLVQRTTEKMREYLSRPLDGFDFVALMIDALYFSDRAVVVCLGISMNGEKTPLGMWSGSTENAEVCNSLIHSLLERGLRVDGPILCVIDGGRGIRKSLQSIFGDRAVIQRCQLHKRRNVKEHLPKSKQVYVDKQLAAAYRAKDYNESKDKLNDLHDWLCNNGEQEAARSLKEGQDETLTLLRLGMSGMLARSLVTTNAIENLMGTIRRITRNVKRWRDGDMVHRWVAMAIEEAETKFRKIKGYQQLNQLKSALTKLDQNRKAA